MRLRTFLGALDALVLEGRGHPDVGAEHPRAQLPGLGDQLVVVARHADDLDARVTAEQGADSLANNEVVGQQHR
jgi:hypothetical protein